MELKYVKIVLDSPEFYLEKAYELITRPVVAQRHKRVIVNAIGCGFGSHSRERMKYLIFYSFRFSVESKVQR